MLAPGKRFQVLLDTRRVSVARIENHVRVERGKNRVLGSNEAENRFKDPGSSSNLALIARATTALLNNSETFSDDPTDSLYPGPCRRRLFICSP